MSVEAAGIGNDPDPRWAKRVRLRAVGGVRVAERGAGGGDTRDGDDARPVPVGESGQVLQACPQFGGAELGGLGGGARDQVGDAKPETGQQVLLARVQAPRGEPGQVQGGPEPVAGPGEVPAGRGGVQAGVDAAEQDPERCAGFGEDVGKGAAPGLLEVQARPGVNGSEHARGSHSVNAGSASSGGRAAVKTTPWPSGS